LIEISDLLERPQLVYNISSTLRYTCLTTATFVKGIFTILKIELKERSYVLV